jgi:hypothetical protein
MFSEVFFTGLYSSLIGFLLAMGAQCYKSKCSQVEFCCIKIIRDTTAEEELDIQQRQTTKSNITKWSLEYNSEKNVK